MTLVVVVVVIEDVDGCAVILFWDWESAAVGSPRGMDRWPRPFGERESVY